MAKNHILAAVRAAASTTRSDPRQWPADAGAGESPFARQESSTNMTEKVQTTDIKAPATEGAAPVAAGVPGAVVPPAPRRGPGHRGADVRDTVAEMTEKAQQLSLEAHSKVAGAMKDVIYAAAGMTGFAIESARDLVQYMVRRGQMRNEEADKLLRDVEEAHATRKPGTPHPAPRPSTPAPPKAPTPIVPAPQFKAPVPHSAAILAQAAPKPHEKFVGKSVAKALSKTAGKSAQSATRPAAKSAPTKSAKPASKSASKTAKSAKKPAGRKR
jgi:hypothetical protein